jgi:hypothetical protein
MDDMILSVGNRVALMPSVSWSRLGIVGGLMMLGGTLIMLAVLGQVQGGEPSQDLAALVAQLGAARYADREAAAQAIERIGRPALAALRSARDARDLEVRTRASSLAQKIESLMLTQATRVQLDFDRTPLPEVATALSRQAGFKIALYPSNLPRWRQQRVNWRAARPMDFWKAVDQLCDLAGLQYNPSMQGYVGQGEPSFSLTEGTTRVLTPVSDHGPFRVSLLSVDYQRHVGYAPSGQAANVPPPPRPAALEPDLRDQPLQQRLNPVTSVQFSAQLLVAAEPRLALSNVRQPQLIEAVDDLGNSLVPVAAPDPFVSRHSGYFGMATGPVVQLQAPLQRPDNAGERIKKLRGLIALNVSSRRPDPLVVPLNSAAGKTFENQDHRLTVHDIHPSPNSHHMLVELSIKAVDLDQSSDHGEIDAFSDGLQRADPQHLQIEVIDAHGQLITWFQSGADAETGRFTLTLTNLPQTSQPKELRYYTLTRASVTVPFEFTDIPMP